MKPFRISAAIAAVAAAAALSGCLLQERPGGSLRFSAPFSYRDHFVSGTFTPTGEGTGDVKNKVTRGSFKAVLPVRVSVSRDRGGKLQVASGGGSQVVRGTYVAKYDGETDDNLGSGDLAATVLLRFQLAGLGMTCFGMTEDLSINRTTGAGSFRSLGGTEAAARIRYSGNFDETITPTSSTSGTSKGRLHGVAKLEGPPQGLTPACRSLKARL